MILAAALWLKASVLLAFGRVIHRASLPYPSSLACIALSSCFSASWRSIRLFKMRKALGNRFIEHRRLDTMDARPAPMVRRGTAAITGACHRR